MADLRGGVFTEGLLRDGMIGEGRWLKAGFSPELALYLP